MFHWLLKFVVSCFRRIAADERANVTLVFAAALPALIAAAGVAIDYGTLAKTRADLQAAADGAAIAGTRELSLAEVKESQISSSVKTYLDHEVNVEMGSYTNGVKFDKAASTVSVSVELAWTPFFAHFLDAKITPIRVDATARFAGNTNLCVLTLDPNGSQALRLDKRARVNGKACSVYSNSTDAESIRLDLDASISAELVCSGGGVRAKTSAISPQPTTDCPAVPDPLADRQAPKFGGCDYNKVNLKDTKTTLKPGVYCGGIKFTGNSEIIFAPGIYIIKDGPFTITGTTKITGKNVGFYLAGQQSTLDLTGETSVKLSGPETGSMAGLLFFEGRDSQNGRQHRINSAYASVLTGTIYIPRGVLLIDPNAAVAGESAYTAIVAYRLELSEGPELILNSDYGATAVPVPAGIKSSGYVVLTE